MIKLKPPERNDENKNVFTGETKNSKAKIQEK